MQPKILHVEDDPDIREIAKIALETVGGLDVVQCESGMEAMEAVEGVAPDILLLDMMMPGMSGEETMQAIRALPRFHDIPFVFMTAKAQPSEVERMRGLGAAEVITKPFDPMTLAQQILDIWGRVA